MITLEKTMTRGKYILAGVLIVFAIAVLWKYLSNPWLWFDEAGQFWISKGLNHYSPPNSEPQGLWKVIFYNRLANMDPGGFSVLLHFWLLISNHFVFIRVFPLLFFIGFVYFFHKNLLVHTRNAYFSFCIASLLFLYPITLSRMVDVRAYSMEMMGITWALYLLHKCEKRNYSPRSLLSLSLCMAFFCTSRYEYVLFAFVIGIYTFIRIIKTKALLWKRLAVFCFPLLLSVITIIILTLQFQNPSLEKMSYLQYLSDSPSLFYERYFLFYLLNTVIVLISYWKKRSMTQLQVVSLMVSTLIVILSMTVKYPWDKIRTISVVIVLLMNLTNEVYQRIHLKKCGYLNDYIKIPLVIVVWLFLESNIHYPGGYSIQSYDEYKTAVSQKGSKVMYSDWWFTPSVRYMYEYGIEKDRAQIDHYPESFRFEIIIDVQSERKTINLRKQTEADIYLFNKDSLTELSVIKNIEGQ